MSFRILKQEKALVGRVLHQVWLIEEMASGPFDVWQIHVPSFFTVTLFEVVTGVCRKWKLDSEVDPRHKKSPA